MDKYENMGITSIVSGDKLRIEIPIKNLVNAFELSPNNYDEVKIKRGKRLEFSKWVAKTIISEHDVEDGSSFMHETFDAVFDQLFEGYETDGWDEFIQETPEDEDDD